MTTTPEQLQAWRVQFEANHTPHKLKRYSGGAYQLDHMEDMWTGYLRRCQETEQAIKDARKQALEEALRIVENSASKSESIVLIEGLLK